MSERSSDRKREFAVDVVRRLVEAGYIAYWAGGCVRDQLLQHEPKDYDVATSAQPEQIRTLFGKQRTLAIGAAFGVICVLGPKGAGQVEVTTFRQDATYSDGRRPDAVKFSTAEEDAQRRDFTMNGLFYDPLQAKLLDFVGGVKDLEAHVVRAILARQRFTEDKLRLLRAVRFAATFDFALEEATFAAVKEMAEQVTVVSAERIAEELRRMFDHRRAAKAITLLCESGLLKAILPESEQLAANWQPTLKVIAELPDDAKFPLVLAALLRTIGNGEMAHTIGRRWKLSLHELERAGWLLDHQTALDNAAQAPWSRVQRILIHDGGPDLVELLGARAKAEGPPALLADVAFCRERLAWPAGLLNPTPLINGNDLRQLGLQPGKQFKQILEAVRDAQLDGAIETHEQALALAKARQRSA